ncbi:precorrin-6y C5,15-methyltransferase (decarboxylating) subunit CbiE [Pseudonocardia sp.]|uniref:precorrin-6y C5,15-methyltransferase (decarboxylating) subunit CbiE n=1 Tax=Pseudonocardia sp. TaxID=60912 RepID=UPI003D151BE0
MPGTVTVVGIGAGGWATLGEEGRRAVRAAEVVLGGKRQLELVADHTGAEQVAWPSPMLPALPGLLGHHVDGAGRTVCVLASGDPMFHGIGATLARLLGPDRIRVVPHPSSAALACARLGWPAEDVTVVSAVTRPLPAVRRALGPGRRVLVLSTGAQTPGELAALLAADGYGPSRLVVLEQLGGPDERRREGTAADWPHPPGDALNVIGVECVAMPRTRVLGETPGLPDEAYDHDGQLTKSEVRAVTLALLAPRPALLLWDVGAGAGSIGIEWMRAHPSCAAVAVESHPARAERAAANAARLGVPGLQVVVGRAPEALTGLPAPDAVFVGGGITAPGVLDACWSALRPGGRLVANAVTVEAEAVLADGRARLGGTLTRIAVSRAAPVGGFTGWRPGMPVTTWCVDKPAEPQESTR